MQVQEGVGGQYDEVRRVRHDEAPLTSKPAPRHLRLGISRSALRAVQHKSRDTPARSFWIDIHNWIKQTIVLFPAAISRDDVTFGMILQNKNDELCCNLILCLAKFFIHKNRVMKSSPKFIVFMNEFKLYMKSQKLVTEIKAQKLYDNLNNFPTEMNN